ncbi:hypothetical protein BBP40_005181 [Aspergillus hancockii]|nr:hypothetical protein BBP40_005181 [Aspergillus hancockii]
MQNEPSCGSTTSSAFLQFLRGADLIVQSSKEPILVIMPHWFRGSTAQLSWVPPVTEEQQQKLGNFLQMKASAAIVVPRVQSIAKELKAIFPEVQQLGIFGFCWGGKLVSQSCQEGTLFLLAAQTSQARLGPEEAKQISVPMALLVPGDEDSAVVAQYAENLNGASTLKCSNRRSMVG